MGLDIFEMESFLLDKSGRLSSGLMAKRLTRLYIVALLVLGVLASTKLVTTSLIVEAQAGFASIINDAGRQRMRSQRLLLALNQLATAPAEARADELRAEIDRLLRDLLLTQDALSSAELPRVPFTRESSTLKAFRAVGSVELDNVLQNFGELVRHLAALPPQELMSDPRWMVAMELGQGPLLELFEGAVEVYENENVRNLQGIRRAELVVWAVTLLVLLLEALLIFRPMVRNVRRQVSTAEAVETHLLSEAVRQAQDIADEKAMNAVILRSVRDAIVTLDQSRLIVSANPAAARLFGVSHDEVLNAAFDLLISTSGPPASPGVETEVRVLRKNGAPAPAEMTSVATMIGNEHVEIVVLRDITARKESAAREASLRDQLQQTEKLQTIGTFAGGIAHDFNNLLTPILGYADLLATALPAGSTEQQDAELIRRAAKRARDVVDQLLAFSRPESSDFQAVDIAAALGETRSLVERTLPSSISLRMPDVPAGLAVHGKSGQLQQVLLNLIRNAADALEHNQQGEIVMDLEEVPGASPETTKGWILLSVSDNGPGMDAVTKSRIFDPFFTTKPPGRGSGLGLSVVYGIVTGWGGTIEVETRPGNGTRFILKLARAEPSRLKSDTAALEFTRARVLVVDDDADVLRVAVRLLAALGCETAEAGDVDAALSYLSTTEPPPDLVLSDRSMPGLPVEDLIGAVTAGGRTQIALMSGFDMLGVGDQSGVSGVLQKPLSLRALSDLLTSLNLKKSEPVS